MTNFDYLKRTLTDNQMIEIMAEGIGLTNDTNAVINCNTDTVICCNTFMCKNCKFNNATRTCREQAIEWLLKEREEEK